MKCPSRNARQPHRAVCFLAGFIAVIMAANAGAQDLDSTGVTLLRTVTTNLNGSGIKVVQAEAEAEDSSPPPFEVNPAFVGVPASKFTYFIGPPITDLPESSTAFPNAFGAESPHGDTVGGDFYGTNGVSTNVLAIANYEADYFFLTVVPALTTIKGAVVNQSFTDSGDTVANQEVYDSNYDTYSATYGTLFVSAAGDGGSLYAPATCYNGIAVGAYQGGSSTGPTLDNGRAKPDITAPAEATSYSAPVVAGAATVMIQAALRGDGGSTNSAADQRTVKALLLNGAVKPLDWSNPSPSPLDPRYGTGVLNLFNSYKQLAGGKNSYIQSNTVATGSAHPPLSATNNVSTLSGWDFNTVSSTVLADGINHYYFNVQTNSLGAAFTGTMTLVWNRQARATTINNLDLFLYNIGSGTLVAASTSTVDNVEHIFVPQLPQGRYDLQVFKHGGTNVSASETYALAFEYFAMPLKISATGTSLNLTWPIYPAGFVLQSTSNLNPPASWTPVNSTVVITNQQNLVSLPVGAGMQFFRLSRP